MSPKIAKEKAQRSLLLWVIICSVLVQTLAKCLVFKIPKEQKGRKRALALQQSVRCFWDQKQWKKRNSSSRGGPTPGDPHSKQAFLTWRAEEHFHTHISPELVKKATAKAACQEEGSGYISPEHSIVPGESDRPGRCSSRSSCFSKPYSIPPWWWSTSLPWWHLSPIPVSTCTDTASLEVQWIWPHCFYRGD